MLDREFIAVHAANVFADEVGAGVVLAVGYIAPL